jgi:16S rRNA (cytidine1402-2'-O)-methyltransferase
MIETWGDRRGALVREISKFYQESIRGNLSEIAERLSRGVKGEMVLVVEGCSAEEPSGLWRQEAEAMLNEGSSVKTIVNEITGLYGTPKNAVKEFLLKRQSRL